MKKKALSLLLVVLMTVVILFGISAPVSLADSPNMKMMVPAYFGTDAGYWNTLTTQAALYPGMIYAVINVNNGPGTAKDETLEDLIEAFRSAGGKILGYVNTWSGGPLDADTIVKPDIDRWYNWYKNDSQVSQIDGIFFDQMYPDTGGYETYYRGLYVYVKGKDSADIVVGNPGGGSVSTYVEYNGQRVTDVICTFENTYAAISSWSPQSWQAGFSYDRFYFLPHTCSTASNMLDALDQAVINNYGWFYCTDDVMSNPWDTLPSYFADMCAAVHDVDGGVSITIDGNASDWSGISALASGTSSVQTMKVTNDATNLYLLIQGTGLNVIGDFFIDTDNNTATGYNATGWATNGCDWLLENNILYSHNGSGWSWTQVATLSSSQFVKNDTVIEVAIPLSTMGVTVNSTICIGYIKNNSSTERLPGSNESLPSKTLNGSSPTYPTITIDGAVSDWSTTTALATGTSTVQTMKVTNDATNLYLLIQGTGLNVIGDFFIDTDNNTATGYNATGWDTNGSDYLIENNIVYHHNGGGWSWTAVATLSSEQYINTGTVIEVSVPLSTLGITNYSTIGVGYIKNNSSTDRLPGSGASLPTLTLIH